MNKNLSDNLSEQHISDDGYSSVFHKTIENPPIDLFDSVEISRDPEDVLTISSLLRAVWILLLILTVSIGTNVFLAVRKADRIVVDKTSGRVVELNNRDYGATENVQITPDEPNETDKKYLVKEFLKALYEVEQTTRESPTSQPPKISVISAAVRFSLLSRTI